MDKKTIAIIGIVLVLLAIPLTVYLVQMRRELRTGAVASTVLSFPKEVTKRIGDTFTIDIRIDSGENRVVGADLNITFDPAVLECLSLSPGSFLVKPIDPPLVENIDNQNGRIIYSIGSFGSQQGTGVLASINFRAKGVGVSPLVFAEGTSVAGIGENEALLEAVSGTVIVREVEVTPTPTPTPTPGDGSACRARGGYCEVGTVDCDPGYTDIGPLDCPIGAVGYVPVTPRCCVPKHPDRCIVTLVEASDGSGIDDIEIGWTFENCEEADGFYVYRTDRGWARDVSPTSTPPVPDICNYQGFAVVNTGLSCGQTYTYCVGCKKGAEVYNERCDEGYTTLCAPTPTPTPPPSGYLRLDLLKVWFQEQKDLLGRGHKGAVVLALKQGGSVILEKAVQLDENGEAKDVELPGIEPGVYDAFVYQAGYLTKKLSGVLIEESGSELDFTKGGEEYFLVGDFNGDQEVNVLDFSIFVESYGERGEE